ncbi:Alpha-(1,6)-fucosyltransferase [Saguinus oedipus]|uniref:Alpha-(1,6)-fucosyltransferase n=1 Tax=Saguinus oedipus TaxID=9490 RepID=A0ABQ9V579_SAGOE|nr:Alpha-(1,6)-fucosyltransferase [Saguinus oedipus]
MFTFSSLNYRIPEGPIDQGPATGRVRVLEEQLVKAKEQIENYKKQTRNGLGKDHEILRRRIENGAKELWFFLQSELKKLKNLEGNELQRHADEFLLDLGHHERNDNEPGTKHHSDSSSPKICIHQP